jgi:methylated-DNA-protein-cysteine methyltransferase-like protein
MRYAELPGELKRRLNRDAIRNNGDRDRAFYKVIRSIPKGSVSTYGKVAVAAGFPLYHRAVARFLRGELSSSLPWQRVVGAGGQVRLRGDAALEQKKRLEAEGVHFRGGRVDMERHEAVLKSWELDPR